MRFYHLLLIGITLLVYGVYFDYKNSIISCGTFTFIGIYLIGVFTGFIISKL